MFQLVSWMAQDSCRNDSTDCASGNFAFGNWWRFITHYFMQRDPCGFPLLFLPDLTPYFPVQSSSCRRTCQEFCPLSSPQRYAMASNTVKDILHPAEETETRSSKWNTHLDACPLATTAPLRTLLLFSEALWKRRSRFRTLLNPLNIEWLGATDSAITIRPSCSLTGDYGKKYHERTCSCIS